jgi:hypothetical protein
MIDITKFYSVKLAAETKVADFLGLPQTFALTNLRTSSEVLERQQCGLSDDLLTLHQISNRATDI